MIKNEGNSKSENEKLRQYLHKDWKVGELFITQ